MFIVTHNSGNAAPFTGEGYGKTQKAAQNDALASLASSIFVRIESDFESHYEQKKDEEGKLLISSYKRASTDLPIIGADFNCQKKDEYYCIAILNSKRALPLYKQKQNHLKKEILEIDAALSANDKGKEYRNLKVLLQLLEQSDKYITLISFLSGAYVEEIKTSMTRQQINEQLIALEKEASSLEMAAKILAKDIPDTPIYIRPATLKNSREVTPFATALEMHIKKVLPHVVDSYEKATHSYSGTYIINKNGINLAYSLIDRNGNTVKASVLAISPKAYRNYRIKPLAPDFDSLLHNGYAIDSDFKIQLSTNKGTRQLLFLEGESVQLLIKINRPGYFYIVGYAKNPKLELSYILESGYGKGARKFVYFVNGDEVNKWLSLGDFEVSAPFGLESLQVVAAENDLVSQLPGYHYDNETGYYIVSDNISQGVIKTRGLIKKSNRKKNKKKKTIEAVLTFSTQSKLKLAKD